MPSTPIEVAEKTRIKRRPTIEDLADAAGVSVATVDRVLNKRHPVREDTARRVVEAAERIGFYAHGLLQQRLDERIPFRTFAFLLQKRNDYFYQQLGAELAAATKATITVRGKPVIEFMDELVPSMIADRLRQAGASADAVAVVAVEHPHVNAAIEELQRQGVPVFTLLTDVTTPARAGYLGLDGRKTGRTAAWTITRLAKAPGKIGILVGSHRYLGQELAEISFRTYLREHAPDFRPLEPLVNLDDSRIAYEASMDLIGANPDLVGIYMAGGGMAGMIKALREEASERRGQNQGRHILAVCNELIPETRTALIDGVIDMVIATPAGALARRTVAAMIDALAGPLDESVRQIQLPAELYISENV